MLFFLRFHGVSGHGFFLKNGPFRSEKIEDSEPRVHPNSPLAVVARPQVVRHTCVSVALIFLDVLSFQIFQMANVF